MAGPLVIAIDRNQFIFAKVFSFIKVVRAKLTKPWEGGGFGGKKITSRTTRLQVCNKFWTILNNFIYIDPFSLSISVYLGLSLSILVYFNLSWLILVYLGSARFILIYFDSSWSILHYLSRAISQTNKSLTFTFYEKF